MAGAIVLESTMTVPFCIAPNTPFAPSSTFSTSGPSGSIVMMSARGLRDFGGGVRRRGAGSHQRVNRAAAAAVDDDAKALLAEVEGHGLAHEAEADEADG